MRVEHLSEVFSEKTQQGRKQRCAGRRRASDWTLSPQTWSIRECLAQGVFRNRKLTEGVQNYAGNKKTNLPETLWAQLPRSFHTHSPDLSPAEAPFSPDQHVMPAQEARPLAPREKPYWDPQGSVPEGDSAPVTAVASASRGIYTINLSSGLGGGNY